MGTPLVTVDKAACTISCGNKGCGVTAREVAILNALYEHDAYVDDRTLMLEVWDWDITGCKTSAAKQAVYRLRRRLSEVSGVPGREIIKTGRSEGYRIERECIAFV